MNLNQIIATTSVNLVGVVPTALVHLRGFRWTSQHDDAMRSKIGQWTVHNKRNNKTSVSSPSYSPAQLKQVVLSALTGAQVPLEPEDPQVVEAVADYLNGVRRRQAAQVHKIMLLTSLVRTNQTPRGLGMMPSTTSALHWVYDNDDVLWVAQRLRHYDPSRDQIISDAFTFDGYEIFKDPDAWWLNLRNPQ